MLKILSLLLTSTNIVNTSSSYDGKHDSPFRLEKISAEATDNNINLKIAYYINTKTLTEVSLNANGWESKDALSSTRAKHSLREIELRIPNNHSNTIINFNFAASWGQSYSADGKFYFDNNSKEDVILTEHGEYEYKFIKGINFYGKTGKFSYDYDKVNFKVYPKKVNEVFNNENILVFDTNNPVSYTLYKNQKVVKINTVKNKIPSTKVNGVGNYSLNVDYNYRVGAVNKKLSIIYDFEVQKNLIGDCESSLYCIEEGVINGN